MLNVRVSPTEADRIRRAAEAVGLTPSAWLRMVALGEATRAARRTG